MKLKSNGKSKRKKINLRDENKKGDREERKRRRKRFDKPSIPS